VDYHSRLRRRIIWPKYHFTLCYNQGPWFSLRYFYPYYHRKYLFVSLGGYWPLDYNYVRYYWYGCHPYYWYGYYPIAREVQGDTYNYYTYNYYYGDQDQSHEPGQATDSILYENLLKQPAEEPAPATLADSYFEEAVKAFEVSNYDIAVDKFAKAMELAPNDMVLPFAYCQALLAAEHYSKAAEVLRTALTKISPEKEGVFYPRGLYPEEEILLAQLDELAEKVEIYNFDADLQLLLGYQLLGIGQFDEAVTPLMNAGRDLKNADAAAVLLRLVEKIKISEEEVEETDETEKVENTEKAEKADKSEETEKSGEAETEGLKIEDADSNQSSVQSKIINKAHATRTKETVLLATLCILAGSTGIGHYFRV
jgi:tetratricopeptide (TPR) repeat protein